MKKILMLGLIFSGCASTWEINPSRHYHVYVDPGFSTEQANEIIKVVTEWQTATNNYLTFDGAGQENSSEPTILIYPTTLATLTQSEGLLGYTWFLGVDSKIDVCTDANDFHQIALHEFGHALGLKHAESGIMCDSSYCASDTIQCVDMVQLCQVWGCNPGTMPPCL